VISGQLSVDSGQGTVISGLVGVGETKSPEAPAMSYGWMLNAVRTVQQDSPSLLGNIEFHPSTETFWRLRTSL
jgi:hypothetical protein